MTLLLLFVSMSGTSVSKFLLELVSLSDECCRWRGFELTLTGVGGDEGGLSSSLGLVSALASSALVFAVV